MRQDDYYATLVDMLKKGMISLTDLNMLYEMGLSDTWDRSVCEQYNYHRIGLLRSTEIIDVLIARLIFTNAIDSVSIPKRASLIRLLSSNSFV